MARQLAAGAVLLKSLNHESAGSRGLNLQVARVSETDRMGRLIETGSNVRFWADHTMVLGNLKTWAV